MLAWLTANIGTILIVLALLAVVALIIFILRKDKKKGKSSCGGNCASCAMGCPYRSGSIPAAGSDLRKSKE